MENHPIPQDVTGFKFRLIGSITLKQFLYLLGAGGIDLALYFLPIPIFVKIPLMVIPAIIALGLAFVPIDGRPMDKMIMNFLRALPAENEFIFRKKGADMPYFDFQAPVRAKTSVPAPDSRASQKAILFSQLSKSYFNADEDEQQGIQNVTSLFQTGGAPTAGFVNRVIKADEAPAATAPVPLPQAPLDEASTQITDLAKPVMPSEIAKSTQTPNASAPAPLPKEVAPAAEPVPTPLPSPAPLENLVIEAQPTTQPVMQTVVQVAAVPQDVQEAPNTTQPVSTAPRASYEAPNVIEGIVRDPRGKPLPHVIVEILDENNIPKRTFRTGQNGMFISATAMAPGTYTIHLEDTLKKQDFTDKTIEVNGSVLPVIEITSVDQREKLRRELFGQTI